MDQKSTVGMMEQPALEEIKTRIDAIIKKALLIISNKPGSDPHIIYSDVGLLDLVIKPIRVLCFEKIDPNTATLFDSNVGALGRCTRIDERHAKVYLCTDCASDASKTICEECFMNSIHVQHNYIEVVRKVQWLCNCGNTEAYENSIPCCKHEIPDNTRNLPAYLFKRIRSVVRHLFRYLELLCGEESELDEHVENILLMDENLSRINLKDKPPMVKSGLENRGEASNAFKSCVVIFKPEDEDPTNVYSCVSFANPPGNMIDLLLNIQSCGYLCVKYRDTPQNCQAATFSIEEYIQNHLPGSGIYCRIIKVHRFFFMKLSRALIVILNSLCLSKSLICDHMSEMVFKETSLPEKFFFNRGLWVDIREFITNFIFLSTLFSRKRGLNLVKFYWKNFDRLFTELLMGSNIKAYLFRISMQIVTSKKQFKYLVINGFLERILDLISNNLKSLGLRNGQSISNVMKKLGLRDIDHIRDVAIHFPEILHCPLDSMEDTSQIKAEILKTTIRLIDFILDFDDMEPLTLRNTNQDGIGSNHYVFVICMLHYIYVPYVKMILKFDDIANKIIKESLDVFKQDMERITVKLSTTQAIQKLLIHSNIEKRPFSIFNFSKRLFFDILTECVVRHKLNEDLKKKIFEDQALLLWISQVAITSLSFDIKLKAGRLFDPSNYFSDLASVYHNPIVVNHLFMQDFNAIQFLITFLSPENFLKYLLFNVCPSIREKTSVLQSLESILTLPVFEDILVLQQILLLIYNALTEMRLVGDLEDPDSYFIKRQCIHMQGHEYRTDNKNFRNVIESELGSMKSLNPYSNMTGLDRKLPNTPSSSKIPQRDESKNVFTKFLNPGSPFYYLNTIEETEDMWESLMSQYKIRVPNFLLPDVTGLREDFKGLYDFMYSGTFLDFLLHCFVKWHKNSNLWKKDSPDLFLFILLCLCLILRVSKHRTISDPHRERMFDFFGPHPKLENRSLLHIIKNERPNRRNPVVASMIDRFINLSYLAQRDPKII